MAELKIYFEEIHLLRYRTDVPDDAKLDSKIVEDKVADAVSEYYHARKMLDLPELTQINVKAELGDETTKWYDLKSEIKKAEAKVEE